MSYVPFILLTILFVIFVINFVLFFLKKSLENDTQKRLSIKPKRRLKILGRLYDFVLDVAEECDVKPFLTYGTLLGKIREGGIICHDYDIDFGIKDEEYSIIKDKLLKRQNDKIRVNVKDFFSFKSIEIIHKETRLSADIFSYREIDETQVCRCIPELYAKYILGEPHFFPRKWVYPLQTDSFLGRECYLPNKPEKLLESWYGPNFIIPDKICDSNCLNCRPNPAAKV